MRKIKVSHEVPIPYLERGRDFQDYEYCLPHLLDQSVEYLNYFLKSKQLERYIVMDNSLHELGKPYDSDRLRHWMSILKPNEFIVPDYWQDSKATLESAEAWLIFDYPKETMPVAVVQANNYEEAENCYIELKDMGYKKVAFSYGASWYEDHGEGKTVFLRKSKGRFNVINRMFQEGAIIDTDRIHLLGCNLPQEFTQYKNLEFIESLDTSNPVIHGLAGIQYNDYGLDEKIPDKVDQFVGNEKNWDKVLFNVTKFKQFI
jgi:hypothetical protein